MRLTWGGYDEGQINMMLGGVVDLGLGFGGEFVVIN